MCCGGRETQFRGANNFHCAALKIASTVCTSGKGFSCCLSVTCPLLIFSLQIITPCRKLILCADNRKEMEDWIAALKTVQNREHFEVIGKCVPLCSALPLLNHSLF